MAPPRGGDGEAEKIPFRWLDAARYAAASVVTVLIITAIVKATRVFLVPSSLYVSVVQGSILTTREPVIVIGNHPKPRLPTLYLNLHLQIDNPRRHASMYYVDITIYLFDKDTPPGSLDPEDDSFVYSGQAEDSFPVLPQSELNYFISVNANNVTMPEYFDRLYNDDTASMSGVTLRMDATLVTEEITSGLSTTRPATYYCWPLAILRKPSYDDAHPDAVRDLLGDNVYCRDAQGSRFI